MADLKTFAARIRKLATRVEAQVSEATVKTAIVINQSVISATPVDTGRARANWQVGLGRPIVDEVEEEDKGGQTTISRNNGKLRRRRSNETIFLSNNVDYIGALNDGSSSQAPKNFVEIAVNDGLRFLRRKKIIR